jgi:hypothetical protein
MTHMYPSRSTNVILTVRGGLPQTFRHNLSIHSKFE